MARTFLIAICLATAITAVTATALFTYIQKFSYEVKQGPMVQWTVTAYNLGSLYRGASYSMPVPPQPSSTDYAVYTNDFSGKMTVAFDNGYPDATVFSAFKVEVWLVGGGKAGEFDMTSRSVQVTVSAGQYYYYVFVFTVKADAPTGVGTVQIKVAFE